MTTGTPSHTAVAHVSTPKTLVFFVSAQGDSMLSASLRLREKIEAMGDKVVVHKSIMGQIHRNPHFGVERVVPCKKRNVLKKLRGAAQLLSFLKFEAA